MLGRVVWIKIYVIFNLLFKVGTIIIACKSIRKCMCGVVEVGVMIFIDIFKGEFFWKFGGCRVFKGGEVD